MANLATTIFLLVFSVLGWILFFYISLQILKIRNKEMIIIKNIEQDLESIKNIISIEKKYKT